MYLGYKLMNGEANKRFQIAIADSPEILIQLFWGSASKSAFLTNTADSNTGGPGTRL